MKQKRCLFPASCSNCRPGIEGGDFLMPFSISLILTQAQLLDSNSLLPPDGEQIFVKSCQFALLFLTQIFRGETLRGLRRFPSSPDPCSSLRSIGKAGLKIGCNKRMAGQGAWPLISPGGMSVMPSCAHENKFPLLKQKWAGGIIKNSCYSI